MFAKRFRLWLLTPNQVSERQRLVGLLISLSFALVYGILGLQKAFAGEYIIQEDARHYLFWMERFTDPNAFPNDLIADYLQSIGPIGYKLFFWVTSTLTTLEPETIAKFLPLIFGMITAGFCYQLTLAIFPLPLTGMIASVMLSQSMWCANDVSSATPRAFVMPLLLPLLLFFIQQRWRLSLVCLACLAMIYPPVALVAGTLFVINAIRLKPIGKSRKISQWIDPDKLWLAGCAILIVGLGILPSYLSSQSFGPTVTMAQAHNIPEFQPNGRHSFFREGFVNYWLGWLSSHSGLFKHSMLTPITMLGAIFLIPMSLGKRRAQLLKYVEPNGLKVFGQLTLASLFWFVMAYAIAFKLFMPVRYTGHTSLAMVAILSAIAWTVILNWCCTTLMQYPARWQQFAMPLVAMFMGLPLFFYYPLLIQNFPKTYYAFGNHPAIYEYLQTQPQETMVASVDGHANNLHSFSKRSTLVAPEYGNAFHLGYYRPMRERATALLEAHYTDKRDVLKNFIEQYDVTLWLVNRQAFMPEYLAGNKYWMNNYKTLAPKVLANLQRQQPSVLQGTIEGCTRFETDTFWVVGSSCIVEKLSP